MKRGQDTTVDLGASRSRTVYVLTLVLAGGLVVLWQAHWASQNRHLFVSKGNRYIVGPNASMFHECIYCNGQGRILVDEMERMCPACFGVGGNYVKREDTGEMICSLCRGLGRVLDTQSMASHECAQCQGRGAVRLPPGEMFCPECLGAGESKMPGVEIPETCWLCSGRGTILRELPMQAP